MGMLSMGLAGIVYLGIIGFFIYLILRFVRAHERIADGVEKLANKESAL